MTALDAVVAALMAAGGFFFLAGTVGLLRFPDAHTRLHALTKVDNVGLGLLVAGLALRSGSLAVAAKLILVWALVVAASATSAHLIARYARRNERE